MSEEMRLQKFLSRAGVASRREAERMMLAGRVRVNGEPAVELGLRVRPDSDTVELDGKKVALAEPRWIAFHKPEGVLTTRSDPHGGTTIYDVLPDDCAGLRYMGRLDRDTAGLLLLTNDGDLAHALQHPSGEVEREYRVEVVGAVGRATLERLTDGVELDDGPARAVRVEVVDRGRAATALLLVLTEGRNREVRRMLEAVGHPVRRLHRLRFGPILLGALAAGAWRPLEAREVSALRALVRVER